MHQTFWRQYTSIILKVCVCIGNTLMQTVFTLESKYTNYAAHTQQTDDVSPSFMLDMMQDKN